MFEYFASQRDGKVFTMTAGDMMRRCACCWVRAVVMRVGRGHMSVGWLHAAVRRLRVSSHLPAEGRNEAALAAWRPTHALPFPTSQ